MISCETGSLDGESERPRSSGNADAGSQSAKPSKTNMCAVRFSMNVGSLDQDDFCIVSSGRLSDKRLL